jgi:probable DNA repair protein
MDPSPLILCSTARLAQSLKLAHAQKHARESAQPDAVWQPLQVHTLQQWLDGLIEQALLSGSIPVELAPKGVLDPLQERILWEQAIAEAMQQETLGALFDQAGMATAAIEANRLQLEWDIVLGDQEHTEETRQFLRWREFFRQRCKRSGWLEPARHLDWQIAHLPAATALIPQEIHLAGFDRISPQQKRLFDALAARGARLHTWSTGLETAAASAQVAYDDAETECRAAVAWARARLERDPSARLAIVVPELAKHRSRIAALLDDTLHPHSIHPAHAQSPRNYDFSLGIPLADYPLVRTALALLRLSVQRHQCPQQDLSWVLRDGYWSSDHEADAKARLDARMRSKLPATIKMEQVLRLAQKAQLNGWPLARLVADLSALLESTAAWPRRQTASAWAASFSQLLAGLQWPGTRSLSSHEHQTRQKWQDQLAAFSRLDGLLGPMDAGRAVSLLARICRDTIFQPEADREPQVLVLGMLEANSTPLDALWVIGMNDHIWPPLPNPNALLPVSLQRAVRAPNADSAVQHEFASVIMQRLLHTAPEVTFSHAYKDGERELRPSPLLKDLAALKEMIEPALTLAGQLAEPATMQLLEDHQAPPLAIEAQIRGGTGLLKAQAICPAWAFYQYRLGARKLEAPVEGLDAMARGSLLHAALQCFWQGRDSAWLQGMDETALSAVITNAVDEGVRQFVATLEQPLPPNAMKLEKSRLRQLLQVWLAFERERPPFTVQACELDLDLPLDGLDIHLKLDRVDVSAEGELIVIDYKTGSQLDYSSWAKDRITEPQLPIYAALALEGESVAAVCFARVRVDDQGFVGVASSDGLLPGLKALGSARRTFDESRFPDWEALMRHWRASILGVVREIKQGWAPVTYEDENDLMYCDVRPLLRLPERGLQLEQFGKEAGDD